ncbi:MAG: ABC transporter permease [Oscillospiraceae bacterium]|nr:ABC transporter permease [Oscillospiraceae bacterium]
MAKYILKRIIISLATLLVLITAVFFLVRLMPGDPFASEKMPPEVKANLEAYYGLDQPLIVQYFTYMKQLVKGNMGYSMVYSNKTVNDIIAATFPYSADLGIRALTFAVCFGLTLGIIAALRRGKPLDYICILVAIIGTSIPDFIMGSLLQYFFGVQWKIFPVAQYSSFKHTILPAVAVGFYSLASISRYMRTSMLEVVSQDYIKTAKSKGISNLRITWKHQIRNAIMPVVTMMGPLVASVLTGTFVIEAMFVVPGMGKYYVESISTYDYTIVLGITVFYGAFLVVCNTIVDILYGVIDPRVKLTK